MTKYHFEWLSFLVCQLLKYCQWFLRLVLIMVSRTSHSEVFLLKGVLRIYSKFTGEHPCRSGISIQLLSNFIEVALRHGCSPVTLLHIFRTPFLKNASGQLHLCIFHNICKRSKYLQNIMPVQKMVRRKLLTIIDLFLFYPFLKRFLRNYFSVF